MKNSNKGFIVPALIITVVVAAAGLGVYVYTQKKNVVQQTVEVTASTQPVALAPVEPSPLRYPELIDQPPAVEDVVVSVIATSTLSTTSTSATATAPSPIVQPTNTSNTTVGTYNANAVIQWSYNKGVVVSIGGKKYNTGVTYTGCGINIKKADLKEGQISATLCMYAGIGVVVSLHKDGTGYKVVRTEVEESVFGNNIIGQVGASRTVLTIK